MFKLIDDPQFTHEVPVMVPVDGGHAEETLSVTFRVVPAEDAKALVGNSQDERAFLERAVVRIGGVVDEEGREMPWNDALRDRLLGLHFVRSALSSAYIKAVMKARVGN